MKNKKYMIKSFTKNLHKHFKTYIKRKKEVIIFKKKLVF